MYREWAPAAQSAQLIGDFNGWQGTPLDRDDFGVWSMRLPDGESLIETEVLRCVMLQWGMHHAHYKRQAYVLDLRCSGS